MHHRGREGAENKEEERKTDKKCWVVVAAVKMDFVEAAAGAVSATLMRLNGEDNCEDEEARARQEKEEEEEDPLDEAFPPSDSPVWLCGQDYSSLHGREE